MTSQENRGVKALRWELCDLFNTERREGRQACWAQPGSMSVCPDSMSRAQRHVIEGMVCLLYTSDAADDSIRV